MTKKLNRTPAKRSTPGMNRPARRSKAGPAFDGASWREGAKRRESAIDEAEAHAQAVWLASASLAVRAVASMRAKFTTDHVWAHLFAVGEQGKNGEEMNRPREPRAMGAVMRTASREQVCERTDTTVCSVRASCHRRPLRIWKSKIHKPTFGSSMESIGIAAGLGAIGVKTKATPAKRKATPAKRPKATRRRLPRST